VSPVYVCRDRDIECGAFARNWCDNCPKKKAASPVQGAASDEQPRAEQVLRQLLAYRVAGAKLYDDDGELQDNSVHPFIDFKRDAVDAIETKLYERGFKAFAALNPDDVAKVLRGAASSASGEICGGKIVDYVRRADKVSYRSCEKCSKLYPERRFYGNTHCNAVASSGEAKGAAVADEEVLALHRQLAAETLRADQGWQRYEAKNRECLDLRAALATPVQADDQEQDDEAEWRRLALQFDGHRMQALAHLRAMLQDPAKHAPVVAEFLKAPPLSGEAVLAERIAALQPKAEHDSCQFCLGAKGGAPGNEILIGGRAVCDYCTALLIGIRYAEWKQPTSYLFAPAITYTGPKAAPAGSLIDLLKEINAAMERAWKSGDLPASVFSGDLVRRLHAAINPKEPT